jgi:hypothetical protein
MLKIYRKQGSFWRSYSILVEVEKGKNVRVKFVGGGVSPASGNCTFSTDDPALQKALETNRLFNDPDGYVLESTSNDGLEIGGNRLPVADVKSFNEAKRYILEHYGGYTQADVSTVAKIKELAAALGISFPNWAE